MDFKAFIAPAIELAKPFIRLFGSQAHEPIQRALTLPESRVRELCRGMNEDEVREAVRLSRVAADANADFVVFVASRGAVDPD